jgi:alpha-beta hydrolase superfamily lysophospholipase
LRALVDLDMVTKLRVLVAALIAPRASFRLPIETEMFSATPEHLEFIRGDPLRLTSATARFLVESRRLEWYIDRHLRTARVPMLAFLAGRDRIIDNEGVKRVLRRAEGAEVELVGYDDQMHAIEFDAPERLVNDMDSWLGKHGAAGANSGS